MAHSPSQTVFITATRLRYWNGTLWSLFSNSLEQVAWLQPSIECVNLIINALPVFSSPLLSPSPFFASSSTIDRLPWLRLAASSNPCCKDNEPGTKQSTDSSHGKEIWRREPQSISFQSFGHKAVERSALHHLSPLSVSNPLSKGVGGVGLEEGGEWVRGGNNRDRCLKGHCHAAYLQTNKRR